MEREESEAERRLIRRLITAARGSSGCLVGAGVLNTVVFREYAGLGTNVFLAFAVLLGVCLFSVAAAFEKLLAPEGDRTALLTEAIGVLGARFRWIRNAQLLLLACAALLVVFEAWLKTSNYH